MNLTDYLKGKKSEVCYKNSEVTDITVTAANIVYVVRQADAKQAHAAMEQAKDNGILFYEKYDVYVDYNGAIRNGKQGVQKRLW